MHERSLVRALLRQVEELAAQYASKKVVKIRVKIGEFSGVEADLLKLAYDDLVPHSQLDGAELVIEQVSLEALCEQCSHRFAIDHFHFICPVCGGAKLCLCGGEELLLESVSLKE